MKCCECHHQTTVTTCRAFLTKHSVVCPDGSEHNDPFHVLTFFHFTDPSNDALATKAKDIASDNRDFVLCDKCVRKLRFEEKRITEFGSPYSVHGFPCPSLEGVFEEFLNRIELVYYISDHHHFGRSLCHHLSSYGVGENSVTVDIMETFFRENYDSGKPLKPWCRFQ